MRRLLTSRINLPRTEWVSHVLSRFEVAAAVVRSRERLIDAPAATTLRILALCLASEADNAGDADLGGEFRRIAAAVTWLERRHSGAEPAVETILLALT
jgi:hypothetical protein